MIKDEMWSACLGSPPRKSVSMHARTALCIVFDDGPQLERYCRRLMKHAGG